MTMKAMPSQGVRLAPERDGAAENIGFFLLAMSMVVK
jgi:hypothetical protein